MDTAKMAEHFAAREAATEALRKLTDAGIRTTADKARESNLLRDIAHHDSCVRGYVKGAASEERHASLRDYVITSDAAEPRALDDVRLLGMRLGDVRDTFTTRAADTGLDTHGHEFANVMLSEAPNGSRLLSKVQAFPFTRTRGMVPVAPRVEAELVARNAPVIDSTTNVTVYSFETVKPSAYVVIDRDDLTDYAFAETSINNALLGGVGRKVDSVIVSGGTDGDVTVPGLLDAGISTVGAVAFGDVLNAAARVEDIGGTANLLVMSPTGKATLLNSLSGNQFELLPEIVTVPGVADGTFVVADTSQVSVAVRKEVEILKAIDQPDVWGYDKVALAARARVSGVALGDAAFVQAVTVA